MTVTVMAATAKAAVYAGWQVQLAMEEVL